MLSRNALVIFLVLLQLFAPLVHAHVDKHFASDGLHLPGLEFHVLAHARPTLQAVDCDFSANSLMVSVSHGIKDQQLDKAFDTEANDNYFIDLSDIALRTTIVLVEHNFSPHFAQPVCSIDSPPYATRAPPSL